MEKTTTCKNCGNQFSGKYCNVCGEKVYTDHDKSILHFFEDAFHFITHFEGTFFNTLRALFTRPGKLSLDYCNGIRRRYFKPLSLFMLLVILYLIFPFFSGLNMPFLYYLNKGSLPAKITTLKTGIDIDSMHRKTDTVMMGKHFSNREEAYVYRLRHVDSVIKSIPVLYTLEKNYTKKSEKTSKLLLLILLPLTALVLFILSPRSKKFFFDHLVLATEINSFFLLFTFFILPLLVNLFYWLFPGLASRTLSEFSVGVFGYIVVGLFVFFSLRTFYKDPWWWALLKTGLLIVAHYYLVQLIYKTILFVITFYLSA